MALKFPKKHPPGRYQARLVAAQIPGTSPVVEGCSGHAACSDLHDMTHLDQRHRGDQIQRLPAAGEPSVSDRLQCPSHAVDTRSTSSTIVRLTSAGSCTRRRSTASMSLRRAARTNLSMKVELISWPRPAGQSASATPDVDGWTHGFYPSPATHRIAAWIWDQLGLRLSSAPTPQKGQHRQTHSTGRETFWQDGRRLPRASPNDAA